MRNIGVLSAGAWAMETMPKQRSLPSVDAAYQVLHGDILPGEVVRKLMGRDKKPEFPQGALNNLYQ